MFERDRRAGGEAGERLAASDYRRAGYRVLEANYRTRQGEIDLIVRRGDTLVFAEVKTRGEHAIARPMESVTAQKQRRLILAAQHYLMAHAALAELSMRFDVVEVIVPARGRPMVRRIENAFTL